MIISCSNKNCPYLTDKTLCGPCCAELRRHFESVPDFFWGDGAGEYYFNVNFKIPYSDRDTKSFSVKMAEKTAIDSCHDLFNSPGFGFLKNSVCLRYSQNEIQK